MTKWISPYSEPILYLSLHTFKVHPKPKEIIKISNCFGTKFPDKGFTNIFDLTSINSNLSNCGNTQGHLFSYASKPHIFLWWDASVAKKIVLGQHNFFYLVLPLTIDICHHSRISGFISCCLNCKNIILTIS
jgi:hypothetical protein